MMSRFRWMAVLVVVSVAAAAPVEGQQRREQRQPEGQRQMLEQRVRERMGQMVQQRLGLSDEQMRRLGHTNSKFDERRRTLLAQERDARMALREELMNEEQANQTRVGELLEVMLRVQRQRLEIVEAEQRELAAFLTPVQRARYLVFQDQIRRRMEEMRRTGGPRQPARRGPPRMGTPRE